VVASAQNADLLYLQHIVALHVPVRDDRFATELLTDIESAAEGTVGRTVNTAITNAAAEQQTRPAHHAAVRGLPAPHRRIHSDVLVFAQPPIRAAHGEPGRAGSREQSHPMSGVPMPNPPTNSIFTQERHARG
jgi:hypothetical protein